MNDVTETLRAGTALARAAWAGLPGIRYGLLWQCGLLLLSVGALPFDRRTILGLNPWIKPIKFELSVVIFLLTVGLLLWALAQAGMRQGKLQLLGWGFGLAMLVENTIIALQAARGVASHMNTSAPLDATLFGIMGFFIVVNTVLVAVLLGLWCLQPNAAPAAVTWGVRLGLLFLLAGSVEGVRIVANGSHTVIPGAAMGPNPFAHVATRDSGPGLPFLNWSTRFGDLRVAHFFALHALQLLPLAGVALALTALPVRVQVAAVWSVAAVYAAGVWWLFAQAMRGLPLLR